jgi:hypothetical protein
LEQETGIAVLWAHNVRPGNPFTPSAFLLASPPLA